MFYLFLSIWCLMFTYLFWYWKKYRVQLYENGVLVKDYRTNIIPREFEILIFRDKNGNTKEVYETQMLIHYQQPFECVAIKVKSINLNDEPSTPKDTAGSVS